MPLNVSEFARYAALIPALHALEESGVFLYLQTTNSPQSVATIATECKLAERLLQPILEYVALYADEVLKKTDAGYLLGPQYAERGLQNILHFTLAYSPVLQALPELLTKEKVYGRDMSRNGRQLSLSSELFATDIRHDVVKLITTRIPQAIVDIGCGSGHLLQAVTEALPQVIAVGIEEDASYLQNTKQISFFAGDAAKPGEWSDRVPSSAILVAMFVFHEFLFAGEDAFLEVIQKYCHVFPGQILFLVEFDAVPTVDLEKLPETVRDTTALYQLMHPLTNQGMPQSRDAWLTLLERSTATVKNVYATKPQSTIYELQL